MKNQLIIGFIVLAGFHFAAAQNCTIILGRPSNNAVTASILFEQAVQFYIEYGDQSGAYSNTTVSATAVAGKPVVVDITELVADKKYYYRVRYKTADLFSYSATAEYSFHTQRAKGSSFSFTIEADEHLYDIKGVKNLYQVCLNNQLADQPDFMLSLGDIFGDDHYPATITSAQVDVLHKNYRPLLGTIGHSVPFFICLGNHEGENDYYYLQNPPDNLAVWATLWRKYYYPNPFPGNFYSGNTTVEPYDIGYPENYYAWTWGDALFVVLDVYRNQCDTSAKPLGWNWTLGKSQYDWLKKTLEESNSQYKFVFAHHIRGQGRGGIINAGFYEWGGYEQNGTSYTFNTKRPGWTKPIQQLFKDNHVTIFFQGHDHLFAKEELDGVIYQEVPMPSDSTYSLGMIANADAYTSLAMDGSGHIRVTVSSQQVKVDYIKAYLPADTINGLHKNGELAYSYTTSNVVTAVNEPGANAFKAGVYPNPVRGTMHLFVEGNPSAFEATVYSISGKQLFTTQQRNVDVGFLANGIYVVKIKQGLNTVTKKITIINE